MKNIGKWIVVSILAWQVRRLYRLNNFKVVAVAGSVGKTSTKLAIAQSLGGSLRVRYQAGNYNDLVSVPLIFFGQNMPSLLNPLAWCRVIVDNERHLRSEYPYDVVVVEIGTDGPGQISKFGRYMHADITVLTSIAPEHMANFTSIDDVALEELAVQDYSDVVLYNADLVEDKYSAFIERSEEYAIRKKACFRIEDFKFSNRGVDFSVTRQGKELIKTTHTSIFEAQLYSLLASIAVSDMLGLKKPDIIKGLNNIKPVSGRMQSLQGIKDSTIIDDSYNASPEAVKSSLETLYSIDAKQKIALLGNMNELGEYSKQAHIDIGKLCDPKQLDIVITLGPDANKYLAPAARNTGCDVNEFDSPYEAGEFIRQKIKPGAIILVKGSQNKVFAEEAIKSILVDKNDEVKLVRQSSDWLKIKHKQFNAL